MLLIACSGCTIANWSDRPLIGRNLAVRQISPTVVTAPDFALTVQIANTGGEDLPLGWQLTVRVLTSTGDGRSGVVIVGTPEQRIRSGERLNISVPINGWTFGSGTFTARAIVDSAASLDEYNKRDNAREISLTIMAPTDG